MPPVICGIRSGGRAREPEGRAPSLPDGSHWIRLVVLRCPGALLLTPDVRSDRIVEPKVTPYP
jgi:hypothetical protein